MTNLIKQLETQGEVKKNGCTLVIRNGRYYMSKGESKHSIDVDCSSEARLLAHWTGFVENVGEQEVESTEEVVVVIKKKPKLQMRRYVLSIKCADQNSYEARFDCDEEDNKTIVFAKDSNDAMKKGRQIVRDNFGRFGPKMKIKARLALEWEVSSEY